LYLFIILPIDPITCSYSVVRISGNISQKAAQRLGKTP
jgi:hypothetical protein